MRALVLAAFASCLLACPAPEPVVDAGDPPMDAGLDVACDSPEDCAGLGAVCRQRRCEPDAPCSDDLECGLGERCVGRQCRFTGCTADAQCATGACDVASFSCAECGQGTDCPPERPVCEGSLRQCVQCTSDAQCPPPGPARCSPEGRCVGCLTSEHCPNGLACSAGRTCVGVPLRSPCPQGTACAEGLVCVNVGVAPTCLAECALYQPTCGAGEICYGLTAGAPSSLVFESTGPLGVCFPAQAGLRGLREPCQVTSSGSNCQPNLRCVPESASLSLCRAYCNPAASGTCPAGEKCIAFIGDYAAREFGVCMADSGFGARCSGDGACRAGLSCQPFDVPSDFDEVDAVCQFNVGGAGALSPCGPRQLVDGGVLPASRACRSGACVNDPLVLPTVTPPYFCFGACDGDADCGDAGVCDVEFPVTTASGTAGFVQGCRPRCESAQDCAGYAANLACRVRVVASASSPRFSATCSPSLGVLGAGESCTVNSQCRSALCVLDDSRGVRRGGVCAHPCAPDEACGVDGGTLPVVCQPTAFFLSRGFDGLAGTFDDRLATPRLCTGAACSTDTDCRPDGGDAVCAVELSPADLFTAIVPRCRPPTSGLLKGGEACTGDGQCASGACGTLQAPSTGSGRACFEACAAGTGCSVSGMTCRTGALSLPLGRGAVSLDSCVP